MSMLWSFVFSQKFLCERLPSKMSMVWMFLGKSCQVRCCLPKCQWYEFFFFAKVAFSYWKAELHNSIATILQKIRYGRCFYAKLLLLTEALLYRMAMLQSRFEKLLIITRRIPHIIAMIRILTKNDQNKV